MEGRKICEPQEVFQLTVDEVADGCSIDAATAVGWRYPVTRGDELVEVAETTLGGAEPVRFSHVTTGPAVAGLVEAAQAAESLPDVGTRDFEFRTLRIPPLYVSAIWLRSLESGAPHSRDRIVPVAPAFAPLRANKAYSVDEFLELLRPLARAKVREGAFTPTSAPAKSGAKGGRGAPPR